MTEKMQEKMKEKKIERVCQMYFSPTGNTLSVTRGILFGAMDFFGFKEFEQIDFTLPDKRNMSLEFGPEYLVIIGVPTYAGRVPNKIMPFIREQIKGCGATGAAVVTYGNRSYDESLKELTLLMKANGFKVAGAGAFPAEHTFAGKLATGRPDENDLNTAREFGRAIAKKTQTGDFQEIVIPGEYEGVGPYYVPKKADGQSAVFLKAKPKTDREKCTHCGICVAKCPMGSIDADDVTQVTGVCIKCQACIKSCVAGAKYFDNEDFISHRQMLEENFAEQRCENVIYI